MDNLAEKDLNISTGAEIGSLKKNSTPKCMILASNNNPQQAWKWLLKLSMFLSSKRIAAVVSLNLFHLWVLQQWQVFTIKTPTEMLKTLVQHNVLWLSICMHNMFQSQYGYILCTDVLHMHELNFNALKQVKWFQYAQNATATKLQYYLTVLKQLCVLRSKSYCSFCVMAPRFGQYTRHSAHIQTKTPVTSLSTKANPPSSDIKP